MSNVTQGLKSSVTVSGPSNKLITNLSIPLANTEVSHALQNNLKQLVVRARTLSRLQIAFVSSESGTKYLTISPGCVLELTDINFTSSTLYIQSSIAGNVIEILELY